MNSSNWWRLRVSVYQFSLWAQPFWSYFFLLKKITSMLVYRKWYVARTNQSVVFVRWFKRCSSFNKVMEGSERVVCKLESSFRIRNVGFSVVLTCIFTALYEKCDTTGQMKDIRLPMVNVLFMLWQPCAIMVIFPSLRESVENFLIKYCLRYWWVAPNILIWVVL